MGQSRTISLRGKALPLNQAFKLSEFLCGLEKLSSDILVRISCLPWSEPMRRHVIKKPPSPCFLVSNLKEEVHVHQGQKLRLMRGQHLYAPECAASSKAAHEGPGIAKHSLIKRIVIAMERLYS
jgi:hypothetical protein